MDLGEGALTVGLDKACPGGLVKKRRGIGQGRCWGPLIRRWILEDGLRPTREAAAARDEDGITIPGCMKLCIEVVADNIFVSAKTAAAAASARAVAAALQRVGLVLGADSEVLVNGIRPNYEVVAANENRGSGGAAVVASLNVLGVPVTKDGRTDGLLAKRATAAWRRLLADVGLLRARGTSRATKARLLDRLVRPCLL